MASRRIGTFILVAILASAGGARAADSASDARMSPDGTKAAVISSFEGHDALSVRSLTEDGKDGKIVRADDFKVLWVRWKDNGHLIAGVQKLSDRAITRLVSFDANGEHVKMIGEPADGFPVSDILNGKLGPTLHPWQQDNVLSVLPRTPGRVLQSVVDSMPQNGMALGAALYSVDVETGQHELVDKGDSRMMNYLIDKNAAVRVGIATTVDQQDAVFFSRVGSTDPWHEIQRVKRFGAEIFTPLAFLDDPKLLYVLSSKGSDGRAGLWTFDVAANRFAELIDAQADISGNASVEEGELLGYARKDGSRVYLNPAWQADYVAVRKAMKGAETKIVDRTADGTRVLLEVHKPQEQKVWWVLDRTTTPLNLWPAIEERPGLAADLGAPAR